MTARPTTSGLLASAPAVNVWTVTRTSATRLNRWIECQTRRGSRRMNRDVTSTATTRYIPTTPYATAPGRQCDAMGTNRSTSEKPTKVSNSSPIRWTPTNTNASPPRKRWRSNAHAGRGRRMGRIDSTSPQPTAPSSSAHAIRPDGADRVPPHRLAQRKASSPSSSSTPTVVAHQQSRHAVRTRAARRPVRGPATKAAFARISAHQASDESTVTEARPDHDGAPVAGSMRWCCGWPPRRPLALRAGARADRATREAREPERSECERILELDDPTLRARRLPHDPGVAADVDEDAVGARVEQCLRDEVGGEALADATEVDGDAAREPDRCARPDRARCSPQPAVGSGDPDNAGPVRGTDAKSRS